MADTAEYWNHNVHYQRLVLDAVPPGCQAALDVGCGDGLLAGKLAGRCAAVTGIDRDAPMIAAARLRPMSPPPEFIEADFMTYPFAADSYDFACANTSLHHMDFGAALAKMARLLRPGGRLVVVGLGDHGSPADWLVDAIGIPVNQYYKLTRTEGSSGAPIMAPGMTWGQARDTARKVLPGVRYRRHLLWRYSLLWTKSA